MGVRVFYTLNSGEPRLSEDRKGFVGYRDWNLNINQYFLQRQKVLPHSSEGVVKGESLGRKKIRNKR